MIRMLSSGRGAGLLVWLCWESRRSLSLVEGTGRSQQRWFDGKSSNLNVLGLRAAPASQCNTSGSEEVKKFLDKGLEKSA